MKEKSSITIGIPVDAALKHERTGVEEYTFRIVSYFLNIAKNNPRYAFILYSSFPEGEVKKIFSETESNVKIVASPHKRFWSERVLPRLIAETKPDVFFSPSSSLPKNFETLHIPGVVTIHGMEWWRSPWLYSFVQRLNLRMQTKKALENAQGIIATSEHTKKDIENFFTERLSPIITIPHGVEIPVRVPRRAPGTSWRLLFVGRKDKRKNLKGMIEALTVVQRMLPDVSFAFSAVGPLGNDAFARDFSVIKKDSFVLENINSFVSEAEKKKYYRKADIFLFPSHEEGFGMPILEAQAHGIPVVCSSFLQEVAGEGALYCDPSNPQTIASAILTLMLHPGAYAKMKKAARTNAKQFSWEQTAKDTLAFIEKTYGTNIVKPH